MSDYYVKCTECNFGHHVPGAAETRDGEVRAQCPADRPECPPGNHTQNRVIHGGKR